MSQRILNRNGWSTVKTAVPAKLASNDKKSMEVKPVSVAAAAPGPILKPKQEILTTPSTAPVIVPGKLWSTFAQGAPAKGMTTSLAGRSVIWANKAPKTIAPANRPKRVPNYHEPCGDVYHPEKECWVAHPELKPQQLKAREATKAQNETDRVPRRFIRKTNHHDPCGEVYHSEKKCWLAHPELKPQYIKDLEAQRSSARKITSLRIYPMVSCHDPCGYTHHPENECYKAHPELKAQYFKKREAMRKGEKGKQSVSTGRLSEKKNEAMKVVGTVVVVANEAKPAAKKEAVWVEPAKTVPGISFAAAAAKNLGS